MNIIYLKIIKYKIDYNYKIQKIPLIKQINKY